MMRSVKAYSEEGGVKTDQELVDKLVEKRSQLAQLKEEIQEMTTTLAGLNAEVIALEKSVGSRLAAMAASRETGQQGIQPRQEACEESSEVPGVMFQRPWFGEVRALLEEGVTSANQERFHTILDMIEFDEFKAYYLDYLWQKTSQTTYYHETSHIIHPDHCSNHELLHRDLVIERVVRGDLPALVHVLEGLSPDSLTLRGPNSAAFQYLDHYHAKNRLHIHAPLRVKTMRVDGSALGLCAALLAFGFVQTIDRLILEPTNHGPASVYGFAAAHSDTFPGWSIRVLSLSSSFLDALTHINSENVFASVEQLRYSGAFDDRLCDEVARMPSVSEVSFEVIRSEDFKGVARIAGLEHVRQINIDPQHIEATSSLWEQHPVLGPKIKWVTAEGADA